MNSQEVRQTFVEYFKQHGHRQVASSKLVPENDPTLLFNNAGMNQFKNLFTGIEQRDYKRAVSVQKCVRAGGKHNDLENVGFTARHHTFFEMLGNFSFGDYFKKDAIHYAWDFLTNTLKIDKDKLYVTVHISDDEAAKIWEEQEKVPASRISRFDDDNFWRMGDVGPCGPCSEIFYDHGPEADPSGKSFVGGDGDRFVEIWNLVFMQYNEDANGQTPLPNPSIDTGAGIERVVAAMQGKANNYDTDIFAPIFETITDISGRPYSPEDSSKENLETLSAMRVLADHARSTAFLMADGVFPSNEGRGYVLRRIMRRALRYGRKISENNSLLPELTQSVIASMGDFYPELKNNASGILSATKDEEGRFFQTLDHGTSIFQQELSKAKDKTISGEIAFKLYDTYGFPVDLTELMAAEQGYQVDTDGFEKSMNAAKEKARASWKGQSLSNDEAHLVTVSQEVEKTVFTGYEKTSDEGKISLLSNGKQKVTILKEGQRGLVLCDRTCFYAESGGQAGDHGTLETESGKAEVIDCIKKNDAHMHVVEVTEGQIEDKQSVQQTVSDSQRRATANNHSATHLLHSALREVLGEHVSQAGSLVESERLRFDFNHNKALNSDDVKKVEAWVNKEISHSHDSSTIVTDPKSAVEKEGALALFGEKYGDEVRVVKMGPKSAELCGGTHVKNTSQIRVFKVLSETGVSAGVRRIEAVTGDKALDFLNKGYAESLQARSAASLQTAWTKYLDDTSSLSSVIEEQLIEIKALKKELFQLKGNQIDIDTFVSSASNFNFDGEEGRLVATQLELNDRKILSEIVDKLKNKVGSGVVMVAGKGDSTHPLIVSVSKNLTSKVKAGQLLKAAAEVMGGKGGGRPDFAQGAVEDLSKWETSVEQVKSLLG